MMRALDHVSLENSASDQSSSNGTLNNTNSDTLQRQNKLVKIPKRNISVKKFVKILRRSVGSSETVSTEVVPDAAVPECQFQSQKVFGVDLPLPRLHPGCQIFPPLPSFQ